MEKRILYKCPYEGERCKLRKRCTALVLTKPLETDLAIRIQCPVIKADSSGKEVERVVLIKATS